MKNNLLQPNEKLLKVLVVDDEKLNLEMLETALGYFQFNGVRPEFEYLNRAEEAIVAIEEDDPSNPQISAIILDYLMPLKNGQDVIDHLRIKMQNELTQVILVTAQAGKELPSDPLENLQKMSINDYIDKDEYLTIRLPISLYNSLRLFQTQRRLILIDEELERQNDELHHLYHQMMKYFSEENLPQPIPDRLQQIDEMMLRLSEYKNVAPKIIAEEAKIYMANDPKMNLSRQFILINDVLENSDLKIINLDYVMEWKPNLPTNNMIWAEDEELLQDFYKFLITNRMIDKMQCDYMFVRDHFLELYLPSEKITWLEIATDLLHVHHELETRAYLKPPFREKKFKEMSRHYQKDDGSPFKDASLRVMNCQNTGIIKVNIDFHYPGGIRREHVWIGENPNMLKINTFFDELDKKRTLFKTKKS